MFLRQKAHDLCMRYRIQWSNSSLVQRRVIAWEMHGSMHGSISLPLSPLWHRSWPGTFSGSISLSGQAGDRWILLLSVIKHGMTFTSTQARCLSSWSQSISFSTTGGSENCAQCSWTKNRSGISPYVFSKEKRDAGKYQSPHSILSYKSVILLTPYIK